jgi:spore germination protein
MEKPKTITAFQATAILISTIIGVGVLPLPRFAARAADSGAPLVTLLGVIIGFIGLCIITILGMRFPGKSIILYSEQIIGRWAAMIGSITIILFFTILTSLAAREFGEVVVTAVLRETPLEITVIIMLLLAGISARSDIQTFAYIHLFYLPITLGPALIIALLSLKNSDILYLQPVWGNEHQGMLNGSLIVAALLQGSFIATLAIPHMRKPQKAMKASIWAIIIAGGLYIMNVIAAVSVFGPEEVKKLLWPILELAKTTSLPANILERLDAAFLAIWVAAVFTTLFSSYYLTINATSQLLRLRDHKMFSWFLLPIVATLAMLPQNVLQMYDIIEWVGKMGLWLTIAYPSLLLLLAIFRRIKGVPQ